MGKSGQGAHQRITNRKMASKRGRIARHEAIFFGFAGQTEADLAIFGRLGSPVEAQETADRQPEGCREGGTIRRPASARDGRLPGTPVPAERGRKGLPSALKPQAVLLPASPPSGRLQKRIPDGLAQRFHARPSVANLSNFAR